MGCLCQDPEVILASSCLCIAHYRDMACVQERRLLQEGIAKFPYFDKLYLMLGQLEQSAGSPDAARAAFQAGLKRCMGSAPLWRSVARLEEGAGAVGKARALLDQVRCPGWLLLCDPVWAEGSSCC